MENKINYKRMERAERNIRNRCAGWAQGILTHYLLNPKGALIQENQELIHYAINVLEKIGPPQNNMVYAINALERELKNGSREKNAS